MSRFRQERFVQELCCDSFATANAIRPYSSLRTSSCTLVWDPGSAAQRRSTPGIPDTGVSLQRPHGQKVVIEIFSYRMATA